MRLSATIFLSAGGRFVEPDRRSRQAFEKAQERQSLPSWPHKDGGRQAHSPEVSGAQGQDPLRSAHEENGSCITKRAKPFFSFSAIISKGLFGLNILIF